MILAGTINYHSNLTVSKIVALSSFCEEGARIIKTAILIFKFMFLWLIFGFAYYYLAQFIFLLKPYTEIGKIIGLVMSQLMAPANALMVLHIPFVKSKGRE